MSYKHIIYFDSYKTGESKERPALKNKIVDSFDEAIADVFDRAFIIISPGTYFLAAIVTKVKFKKKDGSIQNLYVLFSLYSPFPWSGLPIVFAKENVIAINISYRELYSITVSMGRNTPEVLEEEIPKIIAELMDENME